MVHQKLTKALLYSTTQFYALVNPAGIATHIGPKSVCWDKFQLLRPGFIYGDMRAMERSGWQIVPVRMAVFSEDVTDADIEKVGKRP